MTGTIIHESHRGDITMAESTYIQRALCPATTGVAFKSQLPVYMETGAGDSGAALTLKEITSANLTVLNGRIVADFLLPSSLQVPADDVTVVSLIARGDNEEMGNNAIELTGFTISTLGNEVAERSGEWSASQYRTGRL